MRRGCESEGSPVYLTTWQQHDRGVFRERSSSKGVLPSQVYRMYISIASRPVSLTFQLQTADPRPFLLPRDTQCPAVPTPAISLRCAYPGVAPAGRCEPDGTGGRPRAVLFCALLGTPARVGSPCGPASFGVAGARGCAIRGWSAGYRDLLSHTTAELQVAVALGKPCWMARRGPMQVVVLWSAYGGFVRVGR